MVTMEFNDSRRAIYLQIAEKIMDFVISGQYQPESRIPSVREFAASVEVNANTVMRTYTHLEQMGVIFNRRGIGYFVSPDAVNIITDQRSRQFFDSDMHTMFRRLAGIGITPQHLAELYEQYLSSHPLNQ